MDVLRPAPSVVCLAAPCSECDRVRLTPERPRRHIRRRASLACLLSTVAIFGGVDSAGAEEPEIKPPQAQNLTANPDGPGVSFLWRGHLRGTVSIPVPVYGRPQRAGLYFAIPLLLEVYNAAGSDQILPNEGWRGVLGVQGGWVWGLDPTESRFYLGGAAIHESDHATASIDAPIDVLVLNEFTLLGAIQIPKPRLLIRFELQARALAFSCTRQVANCSDIFSGSPSFGGETDLILDLGGAEPLPRRWYFFSAVHLGGIVPNRDVIRELRAELHAGVYVPVRMGLWQLFALGFFGNDVGIDRANVVYQAGAAVRWMF